MATLDDEITALEAEIEGYELKLNDPNTSAKDIRVWARLITSRRDALNRLLDEKKAQTTGCLFALIL